MHNASHESAMVWMCTCMRLYVVAHCMLDVRENLMRVVSHDTKMVRMCLCIMLCVVAHSMLDLSKGLMRVTSHESVMVRMFNMSARLARIIHIHGVS
eukprot:scaffold218409_cov35-Tisochrysis_lutea.AAC.1